MSWTRCFACGVSYEVAGTAGEGRCPSCGRPEASTANPGTPYAPSHQSAPQSYPPPGAAPMPGAGVSAGTVAVAVGGAAWLKLVVAAVAVGALGVAGYLIYPKLTAPKHFADRLPEDSIAYIRVNGPVQLIKDQILAKSGLTGHQAVQQKLDKWYADLLETGGKNNPLKLKPETFKALVADVRGVHVGMLPVKSKAGPAAMPAIFIEFSGDKAVAAALAECESAFSKKQVAGVEVRVYKDMPRDPPVIHMLDGRTALVGPEGAVERVLTLKGAKTLADTRGFARVHDDLAREGEVLAYVSIDAVRTYLLAEIDARTSLPEKIRAERKAEINNMPFREVAFAGFTLATDGSLNLAAYAADGKQLPEFLVRTPRAAELFARIPAEAVLAYSAHYDGGKKTRKDFTEWLKEEMARSGANPTGMLPAGAAGFLVDNLERIESEVVVIAKDFWVAALPVDTEAALCIVPDAKGRWGGAMFFDFEDRSQVETLVKKIFEAGQRAGLPWKETVHEGLTIRYLDLEEMAAKAGRTAALPKEVAENVQLQVGYGLSDKLFFAGTVETIKGLHKPAAGKTLADVISYNGIDKKNALLFTLQPGRVLHKATKFEGFEKVRKALAERIPENASWSFSMNIEKDRARIRGNIPIPGLAAWLALDAAELFGLGPSGPRPRPVRSAEFDRGFNDPPAPEPATKK